MKRILAAALVAMAVTGCRSADSFAPRDPVQTGPITVTPTRPSVGGTWVGTATGNSLSLTMSHDTPSGTITGTGSITDPDRTASLTIVGTYTNANISLTISAAGYQPMNLTGVHAANLITGSVNGSGFTNAAITLTKR